jgi:hypothetical protein
VAKKSFRLSVGAIFTTYNRRRIHAALQDQTPDEAYFGICNLPAKSYGSSRAFTPNLLRKSCPAKGLGSKAMEKGASGDISTKTIGPINGEVTMLTKIFVGIAMILCIGCMGADNHDASDVMITKNTEKFIKYFDFSLDQESADPFKITPVQILQSPLFDKFELEGYSCEVNKRDGVVSEVYIFERNERIARLQLRVADTRRDSIIKLGQWLTDSSMMIDHLLLQYEMERNKIGEKCFYFKKFYDKHTNRYSQKNCPFFFVRHGLIVLLKNVTIACPVGELAKAIDDKILKALAEVNAQDIEHAKKLESEAQALVVSWLASQGEQEESLEKLNAMFNRGELIDLPDKKNIFDSLLKNSPDNYFLYQSIRFLSKFNKDEGILQECDHDLNSKNYDDKAVIAALTYRLTHDLSAFNRFFADKDFSDIDDFFKEIFKDTLVIEQKRNDFLEENLRKMLDGKKMSASGSFTADAPNQYYQVLQKNREYIPELINRHKKQFMTPSLPLEILYLLGECHSFESFDILLENYLIDPNFRSAISLAACTGRLQVKTLFTTLESKNLLNGFLKDILENIPGNHWNKIQNLPFSEKLDFFEKNYEEISMKVRRRAKPILG